MVEERTNWRIFLLSLGLFFLLGTRAFGHAIPVIQAAIEVDQSSVRIAEETDIRILLDEEWLAKFEQLETEEDLAPILGECAAQFGEAVTYSLGSAKHNPDRTCQITATLGEDGELDYMALSLMEISTTLYTEDLSLKIDSDSPASVVLTARDAAGELIGRGQALFPGERSRPYPVRAAVAEGEGEGEGETEPEVSEVATELATMDVPSGDPDQVAQPPLAEPEFEPVGEKMASGSLWGFVRLGFRHIVDTTWSVSKGGWPEGMDHVLFVIGLFLFSFQMRPLLAQITAFTVAHSLTLGLSTLGIYRMSPRIAEPLIAASIVFVALENVLTKKPEKAGWLRLGLVFVFGLVHGLGFANMLAGWNLGGGILVPLLGFNLGVELGQLAIVGLCLLVLGGWLRRDFYRPRIAIPLSLVIAGIGAWWTIERLGLVPGS